MSFADQEALATAINAQKENRDMRPGEMLCVTHLVSMAVNPETGQLVIDPKLVRAPGTQGPTDEGNPLGLSSEGICQGCWLELHSGAYVPCPTHGIQPGGTRDDGARVCPVCGQTPEEAAVGLRSALEARAPAVLEAVAAEDAALFGPVGGVPPDGLDRQQGVLENPVESPQGERAGEGTAPDGTGAHGDHHPGSGGGVHGGGGA